MKRIGKYLFAGVMATICLFTLCGCNKKVVDTKKDNTTDPTQQVGMGPFELVNGNLADREIVSGLKLTNTKFVVTDDKTTYFATLTNTSDKDIKIYELNIIIKNAANDELIKFKGRIDDLAAGETKTIETSAGFGLEDYKTIQYEIVETAEASNQ